MVRQGARRLEAELADTARLFLKGRRPVPVTAVHVPEYGNHLSAALRFPRFTSITAEEGTLELAAQTGQMKIEQKFKLSAMVYCGHLEL